jgi:ubiquinone/menaquinone biosynthesis C-methylase UbiE
MEYEKAYQSTIEAYRKMGKEYVDNINALIPKQVYFFMEHLNPGGKILDVGCAGGRESKVLTEKGFNVVGIDLVDEFLDEAKKNAPKAEFIKMDLLNIDFPKESFDGIWASAVLLHIKKEDIPNILKKFYEILKPEGKLFVAVKFGEGYTYTTDKLSKENRLMVLYTQEEMDRLVQEAGFNFLSNELVPDDAGREDIKWIRLVAEKPKS